MTAKKIIAVVGASAAQGGGLVSAILRDAGGNFAVRALTRDVNSAKARELAGPGAEVVEDAPIEHAADAGGVAVRLCRCA